MTEIVVRKRVRVTFSPSRLKEMVNKTRYGGEYLKLVTLLSHVGEARQRGESAWFEGSVVRIQTGSTAKNFFRFVEPPYGFPCQVSMELTEVTELPKTAGQDGNRAA